MMKNKLYIRHFLAAICLLLVPQNSIGRENGNRLCKVSNAVEAPLYKGAMHFAGGTVEETNHYYPFGALFGECDSEQRYKYNGKELDRLLALDWYDYGARWYDPVLARWHVIDPLCEKYYDINSLAELI